MSPPLILVNSNPDFVKAAGYRIRPTIKIQQTEMSIDFVVL
jgi:hypothetical protein